MEDRISFLPPLPTVEDKSVAEGVTPSLDSDEINGIFDTAHQQRLQELGAIAGEVSIDKNKLFC